MNLAAVTDLDAIGILLMVLTFAYAILVGPVIPPHPLLTVPFAARRATHRTNLPSAVCVGRVDGLLGAENRHVDGGIVGRNFVLRVRIRGRDSFQSLASGTIVPLEQGTEIRLRMGLNGGLLVFSWFIFFIGLALPLFARPPLPAGPILAPPERYLPALAVSFIAAFGLNWILARFWRRGDMDELDRIVTGLLDAS